MFYHIYVDIRYHLQLLRILSSYVHKFKLVFFKYCSCKIQLRIIGILQIESRVENLKAEILQSFKLIQR